MTGLRVHSVQAQVYRAPVSIPVVTSFGVMRDRPCVLVRVQDHDGAVGWGEIWCNYPSVGAEHRARLVEHVLAGMIENQPFDGPEDVFASLTARCAVQAIQSGEAGPFNQCIAGIDIALWDLVARRAGKPLWRMLGGASAEIAVYASGLNPDAPASLAAERHEEGFRAFKLKVGFGAARDADNLASLRAALGDGAMLMIDANQGWSLSEALEAVPALERFGLAWLEEPLRADRPWDEWRTLQQAVSVPLAGGENIAGRDGFDDAIAAGVLSVIQPDVAKWGGFSGTLPVVRAVAAAGLQYCPHWLGGGIGLLASAHLLAGVGGDALEIDANPNPLRSLLCGPLSHVTEGRATLSDAPGLGLVPDETLLRDFRVTT